MRKNLNTIFNLRTNYPKLRRSSTILSGVLSQFLCFYLLDQKYQENGVVYYSSILALMPFFSLLDLGEFANLMRKINLNQHSMEKNNRSLSEIISKVLKRYLLFTPIGIIIFYNLGPFSEIIFVISIVTLNILNCIVLFFLRVYFAIGQQIKFFQITSRQHYFLPFVFFIGTSSGWSIQNTLLVSQITVLVINCIGAIALLKIFSVYLVRTSILKSDLEARYFFTIGIQLGVLYQWDRLWINTFHLGLDEKALYSVLLILYSSLLSILAIDYQRIWQENVSGIPIRYAETIRTTLIQALPFALSLCVAALYLSQHYEQNFIESILVTTFFTAMFFVQSIHNINSGLTSNKVEHLRSQAIILGYCCFFRMILILGTVYLFHQI